MRTMVGLLAASLFLVGLCLRPLPAQATLSFCNQTSERVDVAIGVSATYDEGSPTLPPWGNMANGNSSFGWWTAQPGTCVVPISNALDTRTWRYGEYAPGEGFNTPVTDYYFYAQGSTLTWSGNAEFCAESSSAFNYNGYQPNGCDTKYFRMIEMNPSGDSNAIPYSNYTVTLTLDNSGNSAQYQ